MLSHLSVIGVSVERGLLERFAVSFADAIR
jgi:hypothetical protein